MGKKVEERQIEKLVEGEIEKMDERILSNQFTFFTQIKISVFLQLFQKILNLSIFNQMTKQMNKKLNFEKRNQT